MSAGAWTMFIIGALILWGGLGLAIANAMKATRRKKTHRKK
ncbi:MAG: MetS family NSS transporter small subunit [Bacillota bacterium]